MAPHAAGFPEREVGPVPARWRRLAGSDREASRRRRARHRAALPARAERAGAARLGRTTERKNQAKFGFLGCLTVFEPEGTNCGGV